MIVKWPWATRNQFMFDTEMVSTINVYQETRKNWNVVVWVLGHPQPLCRYVSTGKKNERPVNQINEVFELVGWPTPTPGVVQR